MAGARKAVFHAAKPKSAYARRCNIIITIIHPSGVGSVARGWGRACGGVPG